MLLRFVLKAAQPCRSGRRAPGTFSMVSGRLMRWEELWKVWPLLGVAAIAALALPSLQDML